MAEDKEQQVKPFAPAAVAEEDPGKWQQANGCEKHGSSPAASSACRRSRRRCLTMCLGGCVTFTILLAVVLLTLGLTVYKVRDPEMTLNSIIIKQNQPQSQAQRQPPSVVASLLGNATVLVDVSVKNPNSVSYYFDSTNTAFYYQGAAVGIAVGPPAGWAEARRTYRLNVTVQVNMAEFAKAAVAGAGAEGLAKAVQAGAAEVDSSTAVRGHVKILGIVRHHVDVGMNCTVKIALANLTILEQLCIQHVHT